MEEQNKVESPPQNMIEKAESLAERIEAANRMTLELLDRQEKLRVREVLSGTTEAGIPPPKLDENASARELLKGTGYENLLFPVEKK